MMDSIQRIIGLVIGGVVALVLLALMTDVSIDQAFVPILIGGIAAWAWPVVIGIWLVRRAKARRENQIEDEVQRQLNQQKRG
jgi:TRAP-type C4-dicarboxylate transport system permease large subunit